MPFADGVFDGVLAFEVLEHIERDEDVVAEVARVLRPGGLAVISVPLHMAWWSAMDDACAHVRRYEPADLIEKLGSAGLAPERYRAREGRRHPVLAGIGATMLRRFPVLSNWLLQNVVFTLQAAAHRWPARVRWTDPGEPVSPDAGNLTVLVRKTG